MMINKESIIKAITYLRDVSKTNVDGWQGKDHDSATYAAGELNAYNTVLKDILGVSEDKLK